MKNKDYYSILGVSRSASANGIKAAFRRLAKAHHPDVAGFEKTSEFQDITEAYCVLINPEDRKHYNASLDAAKPKQDVQVEPKNHVNLRRKEALRSRHASTFPCQGLSEDLTDWFWQDLWRGVGERSSQEPVRQTPDVEVILSQEEASRGGSLAVPFIYRCPYCEGRGSSLLSFCSNCGGRGMIHSEQSIQVQIPPRIKDRTVLRIPVTGQCTSKMSFNVLIRIEN